MGKPWRMKPCGFEIMLMSYGEQRLNLGNETTQYLDLRFYPLNTAF